MGAAALPLMVGLAGYSAYNSIQAGKQEQTLLKLQNTQLEVQKDADTLRATQKQNAIQQQLNKDLASARAIFGARNLSASSGTSQAILNQSVSNASRDINNIKIGNEINGAQVSAQQSLNNISGVMARKRGVAEGIQGAGSLLSNYYLVSSNINDRSTVRGVK